jgi:Zn-dependent protease with chaperone function
LSVAQRIVDANPTLCQNTGKPLQVYIIRQPVPNAFVTPAGQICVFEGLLSLLKTEDQLAAVLSHELAHSVARHIAEKMSAFFSF